MAAITQPNEQSDRVEKPYYGITLFQSFPLRIRLISACSYFERNGRKYPNVRTYGVVEILERSGDRTVSVSSVSLSPEDWYRWMHVIGELLAKTRVIYVNNDHIAENVSDKDFMVTNFKGEVVQMVPLIAKIENNIVPAVRIIVNEPSRFADFPLVDIKSMHNVLEKIDIITSGMCVNILGDSL